MPSIDTVGDSYDRALAETVNGYYQAESLHCFGVFVEERPDRALVVTRNSSKGKRY